MMKKIVAVFFLLFSFIALDSSVNADSNIGQTEIGKNILIDAGLTDEHIANILTLYHSQEECNVCNADGIVITDEDINEFKNYYVSNILNRSIGGSYNHYFKSSTGWVKRADGITLSCHYNPSAMFPKVNNGNELGANISIAFRRLKERHSNSSHWKNEASMEAQFHCHALTIGQWKNPWNIEPWRTDSNLTTVIAKGCNP